MIKGKSSSENWRERGRRKEERRNNGEREERERKMLFHLFYLDLEIFFIHWKFLPYTLKVSVTFIKGSFALCDMALIKRIPQEKKSGGSSIKVWYIFCLEIAP